MNGLYFSTNRKCWIFDFLILIMELMNSCLPKRLRVIGASSNSFALINQKHEFIETQSGDFNRGADGFCLDTYSNDKPEPLSLILSKPLSSESAGQKAAIQ
jgi:hypothetical protein